RAWNGGFDSLLAPCSWKKSPSPIRQIKVFRTLGIVPTGSVIQSPSLIKECRPDRIPLLRTPSAENKNKPVIRALEIEEDSTLQLPGFSMADWRGGRLVRGR
ncbi:MAG: hypothetical protein OSA84_03245, partial [Akkermansiaceae bacterium]|nr:hypothetical protein [Akkermansiaceae bacterium]